MAGQTLGLRASISRDQRIVRRERKATTGGENERLREHRIGDFRLKARGGCDARGDTVLVGAFLHRHHCFFILAFINKSSSPL